MTKIPDDFLALSARLGSDRLQIQGPGGNSSIKIGSEMWIKASGKMLADARTEDIFVGVDLAKAVAEAHGHGDGTCRDAVIDPSQTLRPSIETTFHAALDWPIVFHTHSVNTITHAISPDGLEALKESLSDLRPGCVPYAKPGRDLTTQILASVQPDSQVIVLQNHGLICCGTTVAEVDALVQKVERRLALKRRTVLGVPPETDPPDGFDWVGEAGELARNERCFNMATSGSLYPDHVVFLGPALPKQPMDGAPAFLIPNVGVALRKDATKTQRAMLICLADVLERLPENWTVTPIGEAAEAELLDWDAEKYRQALAQRQVSS
ncbi:class II aldolase/adducin family protein [Litoreibacter roseus]|uniref:Class II aldolase/adducin N-terminal domain-containing protein n=1 Tax=Litoreibacter roseus TaxID=2601869 RepID=A0A6N6JKP6_9RHOB|nr:class II aldolase/adducin family protein [Litoreibacter roseus]GFE66507.1 hypothetical protein KIN_35810 [Litoreibacter roseus]